MLQLSVGKLDTRAGWLRWLDQTHRPRRLGVRTRADAGLRLDLRTSSLNHLRLLAECSAAVISACKCLIYDQIFLSSLITCTGVPSCCGKAFTDLQELCTRTFPSPPRPWLLVWLPSCYMLFSKTGSHFHLNNKLVDTQTLARLLTRGFYLMCQPGDAVVTGSIHRNSQVTQNPNAIYWPSLCTQTVHLTPVGLCL